MLHFGRGGVNEYGKTTVCHTVNVEWHHVLIAAHRSEARIFHHARIYQIAMFARLENDKRKHHRFTVFCTDNLEK